LCGFDEYSGQSYEHRRAWVEERLLYLSSVFAIDVCAYAVMSNHVHVVVHVDVNKALGWSDKQVLALWHTLYGDFKRTRMINRLFSELVYTLGK
jgi:hypothetical protein